MWCAGGIPDINRPSQYNSPFFPKNDRFRLRGRRQACLLQQSSQVVGEHAICPILVGKLEAPRAFAMQAFSAASTA
jgi:hypothetical protein